MLTLDVFLDDAGWIVEFDTPFEPLKNKRKLCSLVDESTIYCHYGPENIY